MGNSRYRLIRGCSLFNGGDRYLLGNLNRVATITTPFQRSALAQLARGEDPLRNLGEAERGEIERFIEYLRAYGFLNHRYSELALPTRGNGINGSKGAENDIALNQLRLRCAPELMQSEWIDGAGDGGATTIAARSQFPIELTGRSRVITLLYSILLASGVAQIRFADRAQGVAVGNLDIGFGAVTAGDLGGNYYELLDSRRRELSLFPLDHSARTFRGSDSEVTAPLLTIFYGEIDPELIVEWSNRRQPHLIIHPLAGDEAVIGPLVEPGSSPCIRCFSLYEAENFGFTRTERIPLTEVEDFPAVAAHYIAAIAASHILHFIDATNSKRSDISQMKSESIRNTGIGEVTYINLQRLTEPQVVAITRHPLCGCDQ